MTRLRWRVAAASAVVVLLVGAAVAFATRGDDQAQSPVPCTTSTSSGASSPPCPTTTPTSASPSGRAQATRVDGMPTRSNTGVPPGMTLQPYTGSLDLTATDRTLEGVEFGGYLRLSGSNVVLRHCRLRGLVFLGPGPLTIDHCEGTGNINIDASHGDVSGVTITGYHGVMGDHDGIDVFSQPRGRVSDVVIQDTLLDGQDFPADSTGHGDGVQLRGVKDLTMRNTVIDLGPNQPQKNAAFYAETAGYGLQGLTLDTVWLNGGGYTFFSNEVTDSVARNVRIGATHRYGEIERDRGKGWVFENVQDAQGRQISAP